MSKSLRLGRFSSARATSLSFLIIIAVFDRNDCESVMLMVSVK